MINASAARFCVSEYDRAQVCASRHGVAAPPRVAARPYLGETAPLRLQYPKREGSAIERAEPPPAPRDGSRLPLRERAC
jgi:hypothetical protein